jgi:hypothetical protein
MYYFMKNYILFFQVQKTLSFSIIELNLEVKMNDEEGLHINKFTDFLVLPYYGKFNERSHDFLNSNYLEMMNLRLSIINH